MEFALVCGEKVIMIMLISHNGKVIRTGCRRIQAYPFPRRFCRSLYLIYAFRKRKCAML